jgi:hypothetical protein
MEVAIKVAVSLFILIVMTVVIVRGMSKEQ